MKTTVLTCDVCKQSKSENDLAQIQYKAIGLLIQGTRQYGGFQEKDVCKDCLKKKGFAFMPSESQAQEEVTLTNTKTLETKILDILEDLGVAFVE